jgi:hypothetical protein
VQYLAMNCTRRLAEAKLVPSVGSVGDSYDSALAETINGLYEIVDHFAAGRSQGRSDLGFLPHYYTL